MSYQQPEGQQPQPPVVYQHPQYPAVYAVKPPMVASAVVSLVLSVIGFLIAFFPFFSLPCAIAGVVLGHLAMSKIAKSTIPRTGRGIAIAGLIVGYVALAIGLVWLVFYIGLGQAWNES